MKRPTIQLYGSPIHEFTDTPSALERDRRARRWRIAGIAGALAVCAAAVAMIVAGY